MATPADDIQQRYALAHALFERDEVVRSEAILRELATSDAAREDVHLLLARLLQSQGRLDAASEVMFDLCRARAFEPELSRRGASFIQQCQRHALASQLCDRAIERSPAAPSLLALAGNIARELGQFDIARRRYLAALDAGVDLDTHYVLGALAHAKKYVDPDDSDFALFEAHFRNAGAAPRASAATGFGLAKAFDDLGAYEAAARVLREANARVRNVLPWSAAHWNALVDARMHESIARLPDSTRHDFMPIFIVGLPRSGTTLTASRLAQCTSARDRGELGTLRFIAEGLVGGGHLADPAAIAEAAELYRVQARQDDTPARWYIDQNPMNFRYLRLIEAMFPQARIIVCRRNRRDTALSLWAQDFAHQDAAFAYDFDGIAAFAAGYDRLIAHWQRTLSLSIRVVDYEAFVREPHANLAALQAFIGAPPVDATANVTAAPILSSSVWQARQPIYTASVGRWHRYAPFVPELVAKFADANAVGSS